MVQLPPAGHAYPAVAQLPPAPSHTKPPPSYGAPQAHHAAAPTAVPQGQASPPGGRGAGAKGGGGKGAPGGKGGSKGGGGGGGKGGGGGGKSGVGKGKGRGSSGRGGVRARDASRRDGADGSEPFDDTSYENEEEVLARHAAAALVAAKVETPEEIAAYQEARRRNWPTRANIERKAVEEQKRADAGGLGPAQERLGGRGNGEGWGGGRGRFDGGGSKGGGGKGGKGGKGKGGKGGRGGKGGGGRGYHPSSYDELREGDDAGRHRASAQPARPYWQTAAEAHAPQSAAKMMDVDGSLQAAESTGASAVEDGGEAEGALGMLNALYGDSEDEEQDDDNKDEDKEAEEGGGAKEGTETGADMLDGAIFRQHGQYGAPMSGDEEDPRRDEGDDGEPDAVGAAPGFQSTAASTDPQAVPVDPKGFDAEAAMRLVQHVASSSVSNGAEGTSDHHWADVADGNAESGIDAPTQADSRPNATGHKRPRLCVHFRKGNCRYGEGCRFSHDAELLAEQRASKRQNSRADGASGGGGAGRAKPSLLQALLSKEIRAERSLLLQCIRRIVAHLDAGRN